MRKSLMAALLILGLVAVANAQSDRVHKVEEHGVKPPVLVKMVHPQYTADARARGVQGTVIASAVVEADGTVGDITITQSLDPDLDQEAIKAAKQWRFRAGTKDDKPVAVEVMIELSFKLR